MRPHSIAVLSTLYATQTPAMGRPLKEIATSGQLRLCLAELPHFVKAIPPGCTTGCKYESPNFELAELFFQDVARQVAPKRLVLTTKTLPNLDSYFASESGVIEMDKSYTPKHLKSGECDFYPESFGTLPWRLSKVAIVEFNLGRMVVLIHKKSSSIIKSEGQLAGKKTTVELGSMYESWIKEQNATQFKSSPIISFSTSAAEEKFKALEEQRVDFAIIDLGTALQIAKKSRKQFPNVVPAFPIGSFTRGGWAFSREDVELIHLAKEFFRTQSRSNPSRMDSIWSRYFGVGHAEYLELMESVPAR